MRIGIDCRTILDETAREKAGVAHYTYYLVKHLLALDQDNEYVLFFQQGVSGKVVSELSEQGSHRAKVSARYFRFHRYKKFLPYIYSHLLIAHEIRKARLDVYHSPANIVPLGLFTPSFNSSPLVPASLAGRGEERWGGAKSRPKIIVTIHDLAIYRHPEWFPPRQGFSIKYLVPKTIKLVDQIIVPSQATALDLEELFSVPREKISVIPHGVEERFFKSDPNLRMTSELSEYSEHSDGIGHSDRYILFVGTLEPRKNLGRLIEAYASLPAEILAKYDLVLAGQKGWKYEETLRQIQMTNDKFQNEKIKVLGYYAGKELPGLMQQAAIFVYPSLYEGFGLPVLEAMAAGVPVVTSNVTSMPELCSDPNKSALLAGRPIPSELSEYSEHSDEVSHSDRCAILVNPYSVQEIREAIAKFIRDSALASQKTRAGIARAKTFTWEKSARATSAVYKGFAP